MVIGKTGTGRAGLETNGHGAPASPVSDLLRAPSPDAAAPVGMEALETVGPELTPVTQVPVGRSSRRLWMVLVVIDAVAVAASWTFMLTVRHAYSGSGAHEGTRLAATATGVAVALALIFAQRLYRPQVYSVRTVETLRLWRAAIMSGVLDLAIDRGFGLHPSLPHAVARGALGFVLLTAGRSGFRSWLAARRRHGHFLRRAMVIGTNDEALALTRLAGRHPELGLTVAGVVGPWRAPLAEGGAHWLGDTDAVARTAVDNGVSVALVAVSALSGAELNRVVRALLKADIGVFVSSGLQGIARPRLSVIPLADEGMIHVQNASLSRGELAVKRAMDLAIGSVLAVFALPVVLVAGILVKLSDGGPVFFRQQRVGLNGKHFTIVKLRTMVVDAEAQLAKLMEQNQRKGPLFKMAVDPRVTRVGRFLRATSIDELPQLANVLAGSMSLVGPRPALPAEVAEFSADLLDRHRTRPGITGLWQVEARDDISFESYERLDIYYIENWSVLFDLAILLSTVQRVSGRALRAVFRRRDAAPVEGATPGGVLD